MSEETERPRIGLWMRENKDNFRPTLTGNIQFPDGTKVKVALWRNAGNKYSNGPTFSGHLEIDDDKEST